MARRVAHVSLSMGVGGIEKLISNLCQLMGDSDTQMTVICLDSEGEFYDSLRQAGVDTVVMGRRPGLDIRLILRLVRLFKERRFDVVHSHNQACAFYAGIAAFIARVPRNIVTEHSRHNNSGSFRRKLEKKFLSCLVDCWVTVSQELAEKASSEDYVSKRKIKVILNGVQIYKDVVLCKKVQAEFTPMQQDGKRPVIAMIARLAPIKNHEMMLEALSILVEGGQDLLLVIVGDGPCRKELEDKAQALKLTSNVLFLGHRSDIPEILSNTDLFVLCSHSEGLPLALLEAASMSVPIVLTTTSNKAGLIQNGRSGRVVEKTAAELAAGVRRALEERDESLKMAGRAREIVHADYSMEKTAQLYDLIYRNAVASEGR